MPKHLFFRLLLYFISIIYSESVFPQIFEDEQNPPTVKWRSIQEENFQLIYPEEFEIPAEKVAHKLRNLIEGVSKSIGKKPRNISIILQTGTVVSNGFVQLAPRRSEFFTTPPQASDFQNWLSNLAIHEYRHVVQFDRLTGYLKPPFLEQLALAIFGVSLPPWFYEGDAVLSETLLSKAGRGRLPSWELPFRTNTLRGRKYIYQKDYFGSFRDITPGYYQLGYFMTTRMLRDYGEEFLPDLFSRIGALPIRPYNFSRSLKHFTGRSTARWHRETVEELEVKWEKLQTRRAPEHYSAYPEKFATEVNSFHLPHPLPEGRTLALWTSYKRVPMIVEIDSSGSLSEIIKTGIQLSPHFSYANRRLVWDEMRYDKRFHKWSYSVINLYDLATGRYRQLTRKSRLFSPSLDSTGKRVIAVEVTRQNRHALVLLNTEMPFDTVRFPLKEEWQLQTPAFHPSGTKVVCTAVSDSGSRLVELDLRSGNFRSLSSWQHQQLERPRYLDNQIVCKAHFDGVDNIYLFDPATAAFRQLTKAEFGAFNPYYDAREHQLYFNNYFENGQLISALPMSELEQRPFTDTSDYFINYFKPLQDDKSVPPDSTLVPDKKFSSEPYKEFPNLFNFHSLSPVGNDFSDFDRFNLGLSWLSNNLLNTLEASVGFQYDQNISRMNYQARLEYKRWLPKFSLDYQNRAQLNFVRVQNQPGSIPLRWREHHYQFLVSLPFRLNRLNDLFTTGLSAGTSYTRRYGFSPDNLSVDRIREVRFPLVAQYYFNRNSRRSLQDLAPRWGQNLNFLYRDLILNPNNQGNQFTFRSTFYFPGFAINHSFQIRYNQQWRKGAYQNNNEIPMVTAFDQLSSLRVNSTLLSDYRFPIALPDWSVGTLAFIKRIKGGVFADFENFGEHGVQAPRSMGIELRADMNLLRFYLPLFDVGFRLAYLNDPGINQRLAVTYGISYSY